MSMKNEHEKLISKKATYHKYSKVHITLKNNKGWENGHIKEVNSDFLLLELTPEGVLKHKVEFLPIFFLEIEDIGEYRSVLE